VRSRYVLLAFTAAARAQDYNMLVNVPERPLRELELWARGIEKFERQPLHRHLRRPDVVLECDASATAVAAVGVRAPGGGDIEMGEIRRELDERERRGSSGLREMLGYAHAVRTLVRRYGRRLKGKVVEIVGDSRVAMFVFRNGGSQRVDPETGELELLEALLSILGDADEYGFEVLFRWVPREEIKAADALSKVTDRMDFSLSPDALDYVLGAYCPADLGTIVDRFAADHNAVVERFNARFDTPNAEAVDAFAQYWGADFNFVLGDFNKIDRVLDIIERDDAEGVIIVPERPREVFWRRIWSAAWQRRVERWEYLGGDELVANEENAEQCFFGERFNGRLLLMLTAKGDPMDRVIGLEIGADDYLPKPFEPRELLARIRAILRRGSVDAAKPGAQKNLSFGSLEIDRNARSVSVAGRVCELTSYQFDLLVAMAERAGRVLTRDQIMEAVRGRELEAFDRSIDVHMGRIRAAIEEDVKAPRRILTVRGVGYVFARQQD
jgi:DNA-binding winged helix-turn-helix (wHTH) protein